MICNFGSRLFNGMGSILNEEGEFSIAALTVNRFTSLSDSVVDLFPWFPEKTR